MNNEELRKMHELEFENEKLKERLDIRRYNGIFIKRKDVEREIGDHFKKQDLISVEELLELIWELDYDIKELERKVWEMEE